MLTAAVSCSTPGPASKDQAKYGLSTSARRIYVAQTDNELAYCVIFSKDGRTEKVITDNEDGSHRRWDVYGYDGDGRVIEVITYNADGESEGRWISEYNEKGLLRSYTFYGMNTDEQHRYIYQYEDSLMTSCEYRHEDEFVQRSEYIYGENFKDEVFYDENDSLVCSTHTEYFLGDKPSKIFSEYLEMDINIRYNKEGLPVWSRNTRLNSENGIMWDESLESNPERWYDYTFDDKGNWIERRESKEEGGETVATVRRKIRY